ncbi:JM92 [macacine gammaherpesvirus 11]|uniref:JM92 n=2 Tax=macacine gammaherpesvirus 11 TaxID=2560570 RepID=G9JMA0_9GAMA|nr:JM92 [Macaca fuscata rhadinovirus]AAT00069.1 JM92 [Macaca fuscata rhadinovirus]AEW87617.1 JM92 [Macaca fuscata rhadinovirus]AEW87787.1 JM92 [Macaca fuscata rhadinovirus]
MSGSVYSRRPRPKRVEHSEIPRTTRQHPPDIVGQNQVHRRGHASRNPPAQLPPHSKPDRTRDQPRRKGVGVVRVIILKHGIILKLFIFNKTIQININHQPGHLVLFCLARYYPPPPTGASVVESPDGRGWRTLRYLPAHY